MSPDHLRHSATDPRLLVALGVAVLRNPRLWVTAGRLCWRARKRRWWTSAPFLPVPSKEYLRFRMETQYGGSDLDSAAANDVVAYLHWARNQYRSRPPRMSA